MKINFSIIIPTNNRSLFLRKCLKSVINSLIEGSLTRNSEVIVVSSGSYENENIIKEIICEYKDKKINILSLYNDEKNISKSRNIGVKHSKNNHLVFIDDDIVVKPTFFEGLKELWQTNQKKKIIGGSIIAKNNNEAFFNISERNIIEKHGWCFAHQKMKSSQNISFGDLLFSACLSYRLDKGEEKVFNENFGINYGKFIVGGEDFELCSRLLLDEKEIFWSSSSDIEVCHYVGADRFKRLYLIKRYFLNGVELAKIEKCTQGANKIFNLSLKSFLKPSFYKHEFYRFIGYILYNMYYNFLKLKQRYEF